MIDTYFDRADAALGFRARTTWPADNPLYYRGALYASTADAMADSTNKPRVRAAFPEYFEKYEAMYRQHREQVKGQA